MDIRLRGTFNKAQGVLAGSDICNLRKFWARDILLLENVLNAQLLKTEIKHSMQPLAARKTTVQKRGVAPRPPPEEPVWSCNKAECWARSSPGSYPQALSQVFPSFSLKSFPEEQGAIFQKV